MRHAHHHIEVEQIGVGECEITRDKSNHSQMACHDAKQLESQRLEVGEDFVCYNLKQEFVYVVGGADVPLDP